MSITKNNVESLAVEETNAFVDGYKNVKDKAANLIEAASDNIQEKTNSVKKSVKKYLKNVDEESDATQESIVNFISEYPLASVGIAFLSGVVLSKFFGK